MGLMGVAMGRARDMGLGRGGGVVGGECQPSGREMDT